MKIYRKIELHLSWQSTGRKALVALLGCMLQAGCQGDGDDIVVVNDTGTVAGDLQSIADYLANPTVQLIFNNMLRNPGSAPPNVSGEFKSSGEIVRSTIPGTFIGDEVLADFCFGPTVADSSLEVSIADPSVTDAGARSFVEGSGDSFTVYTAFKSVQTLDNGSTCEIHEVNIFSGTRNADGSFSDLSIGLGILGLVGACADLLVDDIQISTNSAPRTGDSCLGSMESPGETPQNPDNVLVQVENNLVVEILVFLDDDQVATLIVDPLSVGVFETSPGFSLYFESLQPSAGSDNEGNDLLMGEIVSGQFDIDSTPQGDTSLYTIENQVGDAFFFAPLPLNRSPTDIYSVVNEGVDVPEYPDPESGLDCLCILTPDPEPYVVGYYSYSVPGIISAPQASVRFFRLPEETEVDTFSGPFNLEPLAGTVTLRVD